MACETFRHWKPKQETLMLVAHCCHIIEELSAYRLTLRQLYYQLVSRNIIPNEERSYKNLSRVVTRARLAGLLDWRSMRNILVNYPDLKDALKVDNEITQDIRSRFIQFGTLSMKQIELLRTLKKRADERAQDDSNLIDAPEGRFEITGTVLSVKDTVNDFGPVIKMLVKVETEAGSWKTWGTVPKSITDLDYFSIQDLKGSTVKFTGTVKRSDRDKGFSFFSRPVKGVVL